MLPLIFIISLGTKHPNLMMKTLLIKMNKEKEISNIVNVSDEMQNKYPPLSHFEKSPVKYISTENKVNKNLTIRII